MLGQLWFRRLRLGRLLSPSAARYFRIVSLPTADEADLP
jgi:hypothetical protein